MTEDFRDFLSALVAAEARFLVVGVHALAAHGIPRVTGDLDVLVESTSENAHRVWRALNDFGARVSQLDLAEEDFTRPDAVIQFGIPPYRIDVLTSISGVTFEDAWAGRISGTLFGVPIWYRGRAAFIANKLASGRPKDLRSCR